MTAHTPTLFSTMILTISLLACGTGTKVKFNSNVPNPYHVKAENIDKSADKLLTGAEQTALYVPYLKGKRVGMVVNPTSMIGDQTSVDSLLKLGVDIIKIFGPEHGFRGNASAGVHVNDDVDAKTGIKAISLYGKHSTPTKEDLAG